MQYFVRELANQRAQLIAEDGYILSQFANVDEAVAVCIVECRVAPLWIEWHQSSIQGVDGDNIQQALASFFRQKRSTVSYCAA